MYGIVLMRVQGGCYMFISNIMKRGNMRIRIVLFVLLIMYVLKLPGLEFQVIIYPVHGLWIFSRTIAGSRGTNSTLREVYENHPLRNEETDRIYLYRSFVRGEDTVSWRSARRSTLGTRKSTTTDHQCVESTT